MPAPTTTAPLKWAPAAANPVDVTSSGTAWLNGSWVEVLASAAADCSVAAVVLEDVSAVGGGAPIDCEIEVGVGSGGAESAVTAHRWRWDSTLSTSSDAILWLPTPVNVINSGQRVTLRVRGKTAGSHSAFTFRLSLGYYEGLTDWATEQAGLITPAAADGVSVTPSGTAWNNSSWVELTADFGQDTLVTGLVWKRGSGTLGASGIAYEFDFGTGGGGAETVFTSLRGHVTPPSNPGMTQFVLLPRPIQLASGTRLTVRFRKEGTNTDAILVAATYFGDSESETSPGQPYVKRLGGFAPTGALRFGRTWRN